MPIVTPLELPSTSVPSTPGEARWAEAEAVSPFVPLDALSKLAADWNGDGADPIDPAWGRKGDVAQSRDRNPEECGAATRFREAAVLPCPPQLERRRVIREAAKGGCGHGSHD